MPREGCVKVKRLLVFVFGASCLWSQADVMRTPSLQDVRLQGPLAAKTDGFLSKRIIDMQMRDAVFSEARRAFVNRDDDECPWDGQWRGEFWGKSMICAARASDYFDNMELKRWIVEECRRLLGTADGDGYLGSYSVMTNCITSPDVVAAHKGQCTNWNLWNRKYVIWGLFAAFKATGDRSLLSAASAQMEHLIDMVRQYGIPLDETGHYTLNGMPSMSILKPLLMIYNETGNEKLLRFAETIVNGWDRVDGRPPNFLRNAGTDIPLHAWYPSPERWAKSYEMLSCLDGLVEYFRTTGDRRVLEALVAIQDNIERTESNAIGGVGISDRLLGAENFPYASTEVCDVVHWIRLNVDLYLVTGNDRYLNAIEFTYFNAYLASIYRNFPWAPLIVRDAGRHRHTLGQCGYAYNHCCVDNVARSIFDVASIVVTREENGTFHVNLYQDATVALDGIRFEITGNYPANKCVSVKVQGRLPDGSAPRVRFRKPDWCPALDVSRDTDGTYRLMFDMNPRLVERIVRPSLATTAEAANTRAFGADRYIFISDTDLRKSLPTEAYATLRWGPLVLARSVRLGARRQDLEGFESVNGNGCQVFVKPIAEDGVYAPFAVEIVKSGKETIFTKACSYESAGDDPAGSDGYIFSVRF